MKQKFCISRADLHDVMSCALQKGVISAVPIYMLTITQDKTDPEALAVIMDHISKAAEKLNSEEEAKSDI